MISDMFVETQFSVFMVNKPGVLAQVLGEIGTAKINLMAMTMTDSVEHGVMRIVANNSNDLRDVLDKLDMNYSETSVLCLRFSNRAGELAEVSTKLAKAHVNITYAYCTAGGRGGKTTGVIKVADVNKAMKTLKGTSTTKPAKKTAKEKKIVKKAPKKR